ncbi:MAG: hypothetical protein K6F14_06830 [Clostridiales bacterium]|nr:hypothetical protein [Clostridiales bacterium]
MKKSIFLIILSLIILSTIGCGRVNDVHETEKQTTSKEVALTVANYSNYFYSDVYSEIQVNESALGTTYFVNKVHISFDLNQTASIKNIVISGYVDLPLDSSHPLHKEGKLPIQFTVRINANGHGETDVYFQHGTGAYGGYGARDFIITVESITGVVIEL